MNEKSLACILCAAVALVGCAATEQTKKARDTLSASPVAYSVITSISEATDLKNIQKDCVAPNAPASIGRVCADLNSFQIARTFVFRNGRILMRDLIVPKSWGARVGSIVEYAPNKGGYATRLAALTPTPTCQWTGHTWEDSASRTGIAKGFALGLLIVPAVAVAMDDSILRGGVECDGWSYKTLLSVE